MKSRERWNRMSFFWQVYLFSVIAFGGIITLVEAVLEPAVLKLTLGLEGAALDMGEALLWLVGVLFPTLLLGYLLTRLVMRRLENLSLATQRLASGDLAARVPSGNGRDVFSRLAGSFNAMADALQRLIADEKRLLADISHELRSPLTRMRVATALLTRDGNGASAGAVRALEKDIDQMEELVGTLLAQARERLATEPEPADVDFSGLVGEIAQSFAPLAAERNIKLTISIAHGLKLRASPMKLRTIVDNLLANALTHGSEGGRIELRTIAAGDYIELSVRDHGIGVPKQHLEDIFRAFFRVDASRARNSGGTGLGLALVREAVLTSGGSVRAENAEPGLRVIVTFPANAGTHGGKHGC